MSHDYCFMFADFDCRILAVFVDGCVADFDCPVLAVFVDGCAVFHLVILPSSILRRIVGACSRNLLRGRMLIG